MYINNNKSLKNNLNLPIACFSGQGSQADFHRVFTVRKPSLSRVHESGGVIFCFICLSWGKPTALIFY
jgi:hypothetical protein